ncbi:MAG TPA: hypothetical protein DEQ25_13255, partial [Methylophaga sp.]|nr:hypothetical protein [Methylophaga sp.]
SSKHTDAVGEILALTGLNRHYLQMDEAERQTLLSDLLSAPRLPEIYGDLQPDSLEILNVFRLIARLRVEVSEKAFGNYVISMTHQASHILEVM